MRSFVKEVKVTDNEVLLTYTIAIALKRITEEEIGVPCIVHYGGRYFTIDITFCLLLSIT